MRKALTTRDLTGVGGWLAFLIIWMVVLRPLAGLFMWQQMHAAHGTDSSLVPNHSWLVNTSIFWLVFLPVAALSIYGGSKLWRERTPDAVNTAIAILWLTSPVASVALLISQQYLEGNVTLTDAISTLTVNVAVAALWTCYLKFSRRVRSTYCESSTI